MLQLRVSRAHLRHLSRRSAKCQNPQMAKKLARRRLQLQTKLNAFLEMTPINIGNILAKYPPPVTQDFYQHSDADHDDAENEDNDDLDYYDDEDDDEDEDEDEDDNNNDNINVPAYYHHSSLPSNANHAPEHVALPLPSILGLHQH
jgi:phosphopantothenoylcysteine synthetase/decarboxylase